jgi:hypothetical protein
MGTRQATPSPVEEKVRSVDEALDLSRRPLSRSDAEQYLDDMFEFVKTLDPPLTSPQREALIDFVNSRVQEFYGPEVAERALEGRLTMEVRHELSRLQGVAIREITMHAARFILTPEQRNHLAARSGYWRRLFGELDGISGGK